MFAEVKAMLPVSGDDYDQEIITQIKAAKLDLTTSTEIVLPGMIAISRTQDPVTEKWTVTDNSTLKDELVITVIGIWCNMRIGNPPNIEALERAYKSLKGQMRMSRKYTRYGGGSGCE